MGLSLIGELLYHYEKALEPLTGTSQPTEKQILKILYQRDCLYHALKEHPPISVNFQTQLTDLDRQYKNHANLIVATLTKLDDLRESLKPPEAAWWWFPENFLQPHEQEKYDWVWNGGSVAGWAINLAFLTDISSKFISGGLGLGGAGAIIFPSLLALLKARGDLTEMGRESLRKLLGRLGIKPHYQAEATGITTLGLMVFIIGFWFVLPEVSKFYNYRGFHAQKNGDLVTAEANYNRAIALDEENKDAHYNLGVVYEDLRQIEGAKKQYEIAAQTAKNGKDIKFKNVSLPQNNLARLLILEEDYDNAVVLLRKSFANLNQANISKEDSKNLRYTIFKNWGWARYKQELYDNAETYLKTAININNQEAASYCLLAQNYEAQAQTKVAIAQWQKCCKLAEPLEPDIEQWLVMAHKALDAVNQTCSRN